MGGRPSGCAWLLSSCSIWGWRGLGAAGRTGWFVWVKRMVTPRAPGRDRGWWEGLFSGRRPSPPPAQARGWGSRGGACVCPQTSAGTRVVYLGNTPVVGTKALVAGVIFGVSSASCRGCPAARRREHGERGRRAAGRTRRPGQAGKGAWRGRARGQRVGAQAEWHALEASGRFRPRVTAQLCHE